MSPDIMFNIFLGIIAAFLLSFYIYHTYYYITKGPNSRDIVNKIYKHNGKCYKFVPEIYICPINNIL